MLAIRNLLKNYSESVTEFYVAILNETTEDYLFIFESHTSALECEKVINSFHPKPYIYVHITQNYIRNFRGLRDFIKAILGSIRVQRTRVKIPFYSKNIQYMRKY